MAQADTIIINDQRVRTIRWGVFIFFAVGVGLYPFLYLLLDMSGGLLISKSQDILQSRVWNVAFYSHILLGGVALLTGWSQFIKRLRSRNLTVHRTLGKIYVVCVMISGLGGLYIAFFATGGPVAAFGFGGLAISWLFTTSTAYRNIRFRDIDNHQRWMIRSYALTFAAVTLRLWIPIFQVGFGMEFIESYRIIAWLCWVPNLIFAEILIRRMSPALVSVPRTQ